MSHKKDASRRNISAMARQLAPLALEKIGELAKSDQPNIALDACKHILDRAIGKPVAMTADVTDRLDEFTDEQIDAGIAALERQLGIIEATANEEVPSAVTH